MKYILIFIAFFLIRCSNNHHKKIDIEFFGKTYTKRDSLAVEVMLTKYDSFGQIVQRIETIVCNDSIPKFVLKSAAGKIKNIYLKNICRQNYGCILIKMRNVFKIKNDSIFKGYRIYPPDSLYNILKKDIENNGKDPGFSDRKDRLIISISYTENEYKLQKLNNLLAKLTDTYKGLTDTTNMIILVEKIFHPPPPPPPPPT